MTLRSLKGGERGHERTLFTGGKEKKNGPMPPKSGGRKALATCNSLGAKPLISKYGKEGEKAVDVQRSRGRTFSRSCLPQKVRPSLLRGKRREESNSCFKLIMKEKEGLGHLQRG